MSLENLVRYTLGKEERLKSRKAIDNLFKEGKAFSIFPLRVIYLPRNSAMLTTAQLQAGFTVSTRFFKNATDRNRTRRLMKEAYRLQKQVLQTRLEESKTGLHVFFIFVGKEMPTYELVHGKMTAALLRLTQLIK